MRGTLAVFAAGCAVLLAAGSASAQAPAYSPPRAADGHPDLGGVWSNADVAVTLVQTIEGVTRTSAFEDRPEKELPLKDSASTLAWRQKYINYMSGKPQPDFTQGVDTLPNRDRCLMAANAAAPPMTSQGYNDAYLIVQTPSVIAISVEMMDETRIVRMVGSASEAAKAHGPPVLQRWTGDSVGWWEGDTLLVETVNVNVRQGAQSPMPTSKDAKVVERFTRTGEQELLYQAEVTDPATYMRPWGIQYTFHPTRRLWEYACHEGNYGLAAILSGVRKTERDKTAAKAGRKQHD
ncbi:MAG TPA: hypothetical protein VGO52_03755 [Hyphomonadaceae bacterium]|jgi:hypothetical protein|nr:hypothetical protein [Hyphomonadaceae bacterium]